MTTVRQLLEGKGHEVASIEPDKSVHDAMQLMATRNIGALLVLQGLAAQLFPYRLFLRVSGFLQLLHSQYSPPSSGQVPTI